jgi:phosphonoacetaldehyde hydrolase
MTGNIKAVVFDWAGTMVDFGCCAPVRALHMVLQQSGIDATEAEIRRDMGMAKRAHIARLLAMPRLHDQWLSAQGHAPADADFDRLERDVTPLMIEAAAECAELIPGAAATVAALRSRGILIGSNTGYTRAMMEAILPRAAEQGYAPDMVVCAGETSEGRPAPLMLWKIFAELGVWPASACIKVDDAPVGIVEGRNAGCWTVGVAASGNEVGLDRAALAALAPGERDERIAAARTALLDAGAHFVIDTVADLGPIVDVIELHALDGAGPQDL